MKKMIRLILAVFSASAAVLTAAVTPHIGFVYPAGSLPGKTLTVTIGGQYLRDFDGINLAGVPVEVRQTDYLRIYEQKEGGALRRRKEILEAKMAEEPSEQVKRQMQQQIELLEPEIAMVKEVSIEDKMNPAMAAKKQFNPQIAERVTLELTLPENITPGDCELRVITTNGLSNPLVFQIGRLPEITEKEPNNQLTAPEKLPALPVLVNGQIMPGDTDSFRFHAVKGQSLVLKTEARSLVPYLADAVPGWFQAVLALYDAKGREVAYDDDYLSSPDPVLIYTVPEDGDYTFSIRDSIFRGREDFVYRISIGELPFIERIYPLGGTANSEVEVALYGANLPSKKLELKTIRNAPDMQFIRVEKDGLVSNSRMFTVSSLPDSHEKEPDDQFSQAVAVTNDTVFNGTIGKPGDQDWFCFTGHQGDQKTIAVSARRLGSPLDARLILLNAEQKILVASDDAADKGEGLITHHADARIDCTLPESGTYFIRLDDAQGKGGEEYAYRLMIGEEQPDFQLRVVPSSLRIPREGTAIVTVHAIRYGGFTGKIELSVVDAPTGITLQRSVIPEGAASAQMIIAASPRTEKQLTTLEIEGTASCGSQNVSRRAVPAEDMMQAFLYRHLVTAQKLLVQVAEPNPVTVALELPPGGVIRTRPGSEVSITALINRKTDGQNNGVKLTLSEPPEWLTLGTGTIGQKTGSEIILKISPNAEPGDKATVLLNGTARAAISSKNAGFNPVLKYMNTTTVDFTIDAISIEIIN
ncbi:MAG: PPC domain-containing protein [Kiritimatiellales bacterium]|jgi:hypothetical protein